jgi:hypothetical protein
MFAAAIVVVVAPTLKKCPLNMVLLIPERSNYV